MLSIINSLKFKKHLWYILWWVNYSALSSFSKSFEYFTPMQLSGILYLNLLLCQRLKGYRVNKKSLSWWSWEVLRTLSQNCSFFTPTSLIHLITVVNIEAFIPDLISLLLRCVCLISLMLAGKSIWFRF